MGSNAFARRKREEGTQGRIARGFEWSTLLSRARAVAPEAFGAPDRPLNLLQGEWAEPGRPKPHASPVDASLLGYFPMLGPEQAGAAVRTAAEEAVHWAQVPLEERRQRVDRCVQKLRLHRELLAGLLAWEIGKPYAQALVSVDRCVSGVTWYVEQIEPMLEGRRPLGLVSNIASWNYPMSVLMHAVLVQVLAGNAAIAKTPSDGGLFTLTVAMAIARREGLPVSLLSGPGGQLSQALVGHEAIACVSFVGGKSSGRQVATALESGGKRYMLEMEGINALGVWGFTDWSGLKDLLKKGFEYAKQRCTAYPRFVVERRLFPRFLETYVEVVSGLKFGHPLLAEGPEQAPPDLSFGPLIHARSAHELRQRIDEAVAHGAVPLWQGALERGRFAPGQDTGAYLAPVALMNLPRKCSLYHCEPFGPVDSFMVVDSVEELVAEMNVSNGSLVATIACDDPQLALRIARELRAFKVGINAARSRGDREEAFGGLGESWKGCFVGGRYLVEAVTRGPQGERLHGNFPHHRLLPSPR